MMKMNKILATAAGLCILIFCMVSCAKENVETLSGSTSSTTPNSCDTTNRTYTADVLPILQSYCYSCHGNGSTAGSGGISLDGYANLKKWADNGYLRGNITHAPGYVGMPYGQAKLDDCTINTILSWINNGAQDN